MNRFETGALYRFSYRFFMRPNRTIIQDTFCAKEICGLWLAISSGVLSQNGFSDVMNYD